MKLRNKACSILWIGVTHSSFKDAQEKHISSCYMAEGQEIDSQQTFLQA